MFINTFLGSLNPSNLRFFGSNPSFRVISIQNYSSSNWSSHQSRYSPILFTITTPDFKNKKNLIASISSIPITPSKDTLLDLLDYFYLKLVYCITTDNNAKALNNSYPSENIRFRNLNDFIDELSHVQKTGSFVHFKAFFHTSIFLLDGISWNEFNNALTNKDFYVTGGISSKRHIISSTQRKLSRILDYLNVRDDFSLFSYHNNDNLLIDPMFTNKKNSNIVSTKTTDPCVETDAPGEIDPIKEPNKIEHSPVLSSQSSVNNASNRLPAPHCGTRTGRSFSTYSRNLDNNSSLGMSNNQERPGILHESNDISKQTIYFDHSPVFNVIKEKLNNLDNKTKEEIQLEIENFLYNTWNNILNSKIDDMANKRTATSESFKFLHMHVIEFENYLNNLRKDIFKKQNKIKNPEFKPSFKPLFELENTKISAIVFNIIIPLLCKYEGISKNDLLMKIGDQLYHSWALEQYDKKYLISKKNNIFVYKKDKESFKDFKISLNILPIHKGNIGEYVLRELINMGSLLESDLQPIENSKKEEMIIKPSKICIKLFEKSFDVIGFKLPMVSKPASWSDQNDGGYLLNNNYHFDELIHQGFNNVTPTTIVDKNNIYGQINYMSKIPFKINKDVLNYILEKGAEMNLILGSLHEKTDILNELEPFEKQQVISHNSRYYQEKNILGIAELFKDVDKIYFPLFFDWRGRIYTDTSYLNYQSLSLAKSLILFANGDKMNSSPSKLNVVKNDSLYWLSIYGANCFGKGAKFLDENKFGKYPFKLGLDKLSYLDRVNWVKLNHQNIMNLDNDFWLKADEPLLFLAFCFEYKEYNENPSEFITHLPIQLDATCNGLQHLSIMSANQKLARLVNLFPNTDDEKPFDLYTVALDLIKEKINDLIIKDPLYINLKYLNLDRNFIKRPIMTIAYNVTVNGVVEHLKEFFHKKYMDGNYLYIPKKEVHGTKFITGKELFKLASIIHSVLYETYPELQEVVNYFKEMVNLMTKLNLPIVWITPAGLEIKQKYARKKSTRIRSGSFKGASYYIVIPTDNIDKVSQENAFMPNLTHSMDGSTITLLVKKLRFFGLYNLYTIHDCFTTTANNISFINELVRESFCEIYANDEFLINLHKFFIQYLKGNFKVLYNNNSINKDTIISKEMISKGEFDLIHNGETIHIPNLPKTGKFKILNENIKNAIYLIN